MKDLKLKIYIRKELIPPLVQANAFQFGGLHIICAGAMNKENEMVVVNVQLLLYHYIGWCACAVL